MSLDEISVKFLGHITSEEGVALGPIKLKAVNDSPLPKNAADVRNFLGLTSHYRRFIEDFASRSKGLADLTKKKIILKWT